MKHEEETLYVKTFGHGVIQDVDRRIGKNLEANFDLYTMLVVASFHSEYIYDLYLKKEKRNAAIERLKNGESIQKKPETKTDKSELTTHLDSEREILTARR